jgi:hypothetical protein
MRLKGDASDFIDTIDKIISGDIETFRSPRKRRLIPKFVYHFTHMDNAKNILHSGFIYSRKKALEHDLMEVDNASDEVINITSDHWKSFARFYFRPKTPTQYNNEGIRCSANMSGLNSHCPVPIFFLFDSKEMLTREDSSFSKGNLAVTNEAFNDGASFAQMPFQYIYHEGSYDPIYQGYIKNHRHAELIIPEQCSLESLRAILCRSEGEKETFLNLLDSEVKRNYEDITFVDTRNDFYNGEYTYVEKANLTKEQIVLTINKGLGQPTFNAFLEIKEHSTNIVYRWRKEDFTPRQLEPFDLVNLQDTTSYDVKFYLDDHLAYCGYFEDGDILPF